MQAPIQLCMDVFAREHPTNKHTCNTYRIIFFTTSVCFEPWLLLILVYQNFPNQTCHNALDPPKAKGRCPKSPIIPMAMS